MIPKACVKVFLVFIFVFLSVAMAQWRRDTRIKIFSKENRQGDQESVSVMNCLTLSYVAYARPKIPTVHSIAFEPDVTRDCLRFYKFECCTGEFLDFDPDEESDGSPRLNQIHTNVADDAEWFDPKSVGPCDSNSSSSFLGSVPPPDYLTEPYTTPQEALKDNTNIKRFEDENAAVYISYEQELGNDVNWLYDIFSLGWAYVKSTYGNYGSEGRVYGIYHGDSHSNEDQSRLATYKTPESNCRNVISVFSTQESSTAAQEMDKSELDSITLQMAHLVDGMYGGIRDSPNTQLWTDNQAWADIFRYDLYLKLGMSQDARRIALEATNRISDNPNPDSNWFRDWFKHIYDKYNGTQSLVRFFELRQEHWPKDESSSFDTNFIGDMNLGEYVHFTSGAAGTNLWPEARSAFKLYKRYYTWKKQFDDAQKTYRGFTYKDFHKYKN